MFTRFTPKPIFGYQFVNRLWVQPYTTGWAMISSPGTRMELIEAEMADMPDVKVTQHSPPSASHSSPSKSERVGSSRRS